MTISGPQFRIALALAICTATVISVAASREPGLWEITTTTTWQKAPSVPGEDGARLMGGTRKKQVCLTEEIIDQFGALLPQSRGQCTIQNKIIKPGTITADYVCTGMMTGKGTLESVWKDSGHANGKVHFTGTFMVGSDPQPIEWTTESTSVFKSSSCGGIKPPPLPKPLH